MTFPMQPTNQIMRPARRFKPALLVAFVASLVPTGQAVAWDEYETRLMEILNGIRAGETNQALDSTRNLIRAQPASRLGNLLYADLMAAKSAALRHIGGQSTPQDSERLDGLVHELTTRWSRHNLKIDVLENKVPSRLIQASKNSRNIVYADLSESRLYVYENYRGELKLVKDFFVTQGLKGAHKRREGDQKTPVGVYFTTGFISGNSLPSRYGPGALPITYPNPIDKQYQRTGYGIWIHGTEPYLLNRAPQASDGCLSLNNEDFLKLNDVLHRRQHVPVIIDDAPNWVSRNFLIKRKSEIMSAISAWERAWESRDPDTLFAYYDPTRFTTGDDNYTTWARKKALALQIHHNLEITIKDLEIFEYPGEEGVVFADFQQQLVSDKFSSTIRKQQYWKKDHTGQWKVIFEGLSDKPQPVSKIARNATNSSRPSS